MANRIPFFISYACHIVSFVLCSLSYGTGYWLVAEGEDRLFLRLGLWETCFNGYEHTSDYVGKAYHGCWWIFHKEYSYIREWIMPCEYTCIFRFNLEPSFTVEFMKSPEAIKIQGFK